MPNIRTVVLDNMTNGQPKKIQKKKRNSSNGPGSAAVRSSSGTVGGQQYAKIPNLSSVVGGFNGSDLFVERTEALWTITAAATAGNFKCEPLVQHVGQSNLLWLANMSNSYSEYEVHRVEYTYVPSVPTTTAGNVAFSFYSDVRDGTPSSLSQMLASEQSLMAPAYAGGDGGTYLQRFGAPSGNVVSFELPQHIIKFSNGVPKRFKVTSAAGADAIIGAANGSSVINQYAWGELNIASSGAEANKVLGIVFVRYRIRLMGPLPIANQN